MVGPYETTFVHLALGWTAEEGGPIWLALPFLAVLLSCALWHIVQCVRLRLISLFVGRLYGLILLSVIAPIYFLPFWPVALVAHCIYLRARYESLAPESRHLLIVTTSSGAVPPAQDTPVTTDVPHAHDE